MEAYSKLLIQLAGAYDDETLISLTPAVSAEELTRTRQTIRDAIRGGSSLSFADASIFEAMECLLVLPIHGEPTPTNAIAATYFLKAYADGGGDASDLYFGASIACLVALAVSDSGRWATPIKAFLEALQVPFAADQHEALMWIARLMIAAFQDAKDNGQAQVLACLHDLAGRYEGTTVYRLLEKAWFASLRVKP